MSFTSLDFIYIFLPLVLTGFYLINKTYPRLQVFFLLGVSFFYCGYVDPTAALILACSIGLNYSLAHTIRRLKGKGAKQALLTTGILMNVAALLWYKFSLETSFRNVEAAAGQGNVFLDIGIPLGISFYTFYQISFLVDTYKSEAQFLGFFNYGLSASMFSQLPAGPILNYNDGLTQFGQVGTRAIEWTKLFKGLSLFSLGLVKKVYLADYLGTAINQLHYAVSTGQELNALEAFVVTWGFLVQLYFDFSAYSDMAIGLGLCFGLTFPVNFDSPLKASTFGDFISRWHMSLIAFTRTYIFLPVSKKVKKMARGKAVRRQFIGWMVGLQVSFLVINIWHAPTLMLVLQGLFLGVFFVVVKVLGMGIGNLMSRQSLQNKWVDGLKNVLGRVIVMASISVFAVLLKTKSFEEVRRLFSGFKKWPVFDADSKTNGFSNRVLELFTSDRAFPTVEEPIKFLDAGSLPIPVFTFLMLLSLIVFIFPSTMQVFGLIRMPENRWYSKLSWKPNLIWGLLVGLLLSLYAMFANEDLTKEFLYGGF